MKIEDGAMKLIPTRSGSKDLNAATGAPIFRLEIVREHLELTKLFNRGEIKNDAPAFRNGEPGTINQHFLTTSVTAINAAIPRSIVYAGCKGNKGLRISQSATDKKRGVFHKLRLKPRAEVRRGWCQ